MAVRVVGDGGSVSHDEIEIAVAVEIHERGLPSYPVRVVADFEPRLALGHESRRQRASHVLVLHERPAALPEE